jgi:molybdopterin converting factor subunit 1
MSKLISILYFAWLRERIGVAREDLALPDAVVTLESLIDDLASRDARHAAAFQNRASIRCAVNQQFADLSSPVRPGDEVAFFPPVTGG